MRIEPNEQGYTLQIMNPRTREWEDVECHDTPDSALLAGDYYWEALGPAARILSPQRIVHGGVVGDEWDGSDPEVLRDLEWVVGPRTVRIYDPDRGEECRVLEITEAGGPTILRSFDRPQDLVLYLIDIESGAVPDELAPRRATVYKRLGINRNSLTVIVTEAAQSLMLGHGDPVRITLERIEPGRFVVRDQDGRVAQAYEVPSEAMRDCRERNARSRSGVRWEVWDTVDGVEWR